MLRAKRGGKQAKELEKSVITAFSTGWFKAAAAAMGMEPEALAERVVRAPKSTLASLRRELRVEMGAEDTEAMRREAQEAVE